MFRPSFSFFWVSLAKFVERSKFVHSSSVRPSLPFVIQFIETERVCTTKYILVCYTLSNPQFSHVIFFLFLGATSFKGQEKSYIFWLYHDHEIQDIYVHTHTHTYTNKQTKIYHPTPFFFSFSLSCILVVVVQLLPARGKEGLVIAPGGGGGGVTTLLMPSVWSVRLLELSEIYSTTKNGSSGNDRSISVTWVHFDSSRLDWTTDVCHCKNFPCKSFKMSGCAVDKSCRSSKSVCKSYSCGR